MRATLDAVPDYSIPDEGSFHMDTNSVPCTELQILPCSGGD
jgi:hypothetical protein